MSIERLINQIINRRLNPVIVLGHVTSIDENEGTCTVQPVHGSSEYLKVRLQPTQGALNGFYLIPKEGTACVIVKLGSSEASTLLVACDEFSKAALNGNQVILGGVDGEPAVLGNKLNAQLSDFHKWVRDIHQSLGPVFAALGLAGQASLITANETHRAAQQGQLDNNQSSRVKIHE